MANLVGTGGNDTITSAVSGGVAGGVASGLSDFILGQGGNDSIDGQGGLDSIFGGFGNDTIAVRTGATINGEDGSDTYRVSGNPGAGTSINDNGITGTDLLDQSTSTNISAISISGIETLGLRGTTLTLTRAQLDAFTTITSAGGATFGRIALLNGGSATTAVTGLTTLEVTGSGSADTLIFTGTSHLLINAGDGNDSLRGGDGADDLNGQGGNDTIDGGVGADALNGGLGDDLYILRNGDSVLDVGGNNTVALAENPGNTSTLNMGGGIDTLRPLADVFIADMALFGVENLAVNGFQVSLSLAQYDSLAIIADGAAPLGRILLTTGGVASTKTVTGLGTLEIIGSGADDLLTLNSSAVTPTRFNVLSGFGNDSILTAGGADTIDGGAGNDSMDGFGGIDKLLGGAGNDLIRVRDGDKAEGGDNEDRIQLVTAAVPVGFVSMDGGNGVDALFVNGTHLLTAGDTVQNFETLLLNGANLTMTGAQFLDFNTVDVNAEALAFAASTVTLSSAAVMPLGTAMVVKNVPALTINASNQADVLNFSTPNTLGVAFTPMTILAGDGGDVIGGGNAADLIAGGAGNDTLSGWNGDDTLGGGDGIDQLSGEEGNDELDIENGDSGDGGNGNDRFQLNGSLSLASTLTGGAGTDTMIFSLPGIVLGAAVSISTDFEVMEISGAQTVTMTGFQLRAFDSILLDNASGASIVLTSTASVSLTASGSGLLSISGADHPILGDLLDFGSSGAGTALVLNGNAGNDTLVGGAANVTLNGGNDNDDLVGGLGNDSLDGGAGNDLLVGGAGADVMFGQDGNDLFLVADGDTVQAGNDDDRVLVDGSMATGSLDGGLGTDILDGSLGGALGAAVVVTGFETLAVTDAGFSLAGTQLAGITTLRGSGAATLGTLTITSAVTATFAVDAGLTLLGVTASAAADSLTFTAGTGSSVFVNSLGGDDTLNTGDGADEISAGDGKDLVNTGAGDDTIAGEAGVDRINAGGGADVIFGGAGADRLKGGGGADIFGYGADSDGKDRISDFVAGTDRIQVSAAGFGGGLADGVALTAGQLVVQATNGTTAPAGTGQFVFNTTSQTLLWDADGAGGVSGTAIAVLTGVAGLAVTDIQVIA